MQDDEIKFDHSSTKPVLAILFVFMLIGAFAWGYRNGKLSGHPNEEMVADNIEYLLFEAPYKQAFMQDTLTLGSIKNYYSWYGDISRSIMVSYARDICFSNIGKKLKNKEPIQSVQEADIMVSLIKDEICNPKNITKPIFDVGDNPR